MPGRGGGGHLHAPLALRLGRSDPHRPRRPQAAVLLPPGGGSPQAAGRHGGGLPPHPAGAGVLYAGLL